MSKENQSFFRTTLRHFAALRDNVPENAPVNMADNAPVNASDTPVNTPDSAPDGAPDGSPNGAPAGAANGAPDTPGDAPDTPQTALPFPDDWFDLPSGTFADFGAMYYLMSLTPFNRNRSLAQVTAQLEPPLRLGQYRLFRSNGFPRAFVTWAGLDPKAEMRFAVTNQALAPQDWNSGSSIWLVDFIAPFGQVEQMIPMLIRNPSISRVRTLWHNKPGTRRRVVEWNRTDPLPDIRMKSYGVNQFEKQLREG